MDKIGKIRSELMKERAKSIQFKSGIPMSNNWHWHDGRESALSFALNKLSEIVEKSGQTKKVLYK